MSEQSRPLPGGVLEMTFCHLIEWFPGVCCNCRLLRARNGKKKVWINDHIDQIPIREFPTRLTTTHNRGLQSILASGRGNIRIDTNTTNFLLGCAADHRIQYSNLALNLFASVFSFWVCSDRVRSIYSKED